MKRAPKKLAEVVVLPTVKADGRIARFDAALERAQDVVKKRDRAHAHAALGDLEAAQRDVVRFAIDGAYGDEGAVHPLMALGNVVRKAWDVSLATVDLKALIASKQPAESGVPAVVIDLHAVRTALRVRARRARRGAR